MTWSVNTDYTDARGPRGAARPHHAHPAAGRASARTLVDTYTVRRSHASLLDLALIMETDASGFRTGVDRQAERKSEMGQAPVYVYRFQWYSPVSGGRLRAMHCMDIPFAFDNVDNSQAIVGNGPGRQALADRMSRAWVAFRAERRSESRRPAALGTVLGRPARHDDAEQRVPSGPRPVR